MILANHTVDLCCRVVYEHNYTNITVAMLYNWVCLAYLYGMLEIISGVYCFEIVSIRVDHLLVTVSINYCLRYIIYSKQYEIVIIGDDGIIDCVIIISCVMYVYT